MGPFVKFPCFLPQLCADLSKKSKSVKAIYLCASESCHPTLSENGMVFRGLGTVHEITAIKVSKKMLTQQKIKKIFRLQTLISSKQ